MKRITAIILASIMLLAVLCSCADSGSSETTTAATVETTAPAVEETTAEETVAANVRDDLPESKQFNDKFVILSRKSTSYEVTTNEVTGDIVKDAVSERNQKIEERFGVDIEVVEVAGDWGDRTSFINHVSSVVSSGSVAYDIIMTHSAYIVNFGISGYAYNMKELENIDFSKKWWSSYYADNVLINGKQYSAIGDIGYTLYENMICLFVNKGLAQEYNVGDVYQYVNDGTWTFEKMMSYAKLVYVDSNNDSTVNSGDTFGFGLGNHAARGAMTMWDAKITVKNDEGKQVLNIPNEKYIDIYNIMYDTIYNNSQNVTYKSEGSNLATEFADEHILFYAEKLGLASKFKDMTSEYGVVPFPKYNEDQENYISTSRDFMSAVAVLSTIDNPEMVGTVTEALAMYGYTTVTPQYYELTLKYKYMSDPDAVAMLDLIHDTITHDFAMTFTNSLNLVYSIAGDNLSSGTKDITKNVTANKKAIQKALDNLYAAYEK